MMSVVIDSHGTFLGKRGRSLYIKPSEGSPSRRSLYNLTEVIVMANCSISSQAIELLAQNGIPLVMIRSGQPYAIVHPFFNHGTVHTRREQLNAYNDFRGGHLARAFVLGAQRNRQRMLQYWARNRQSNDSDIADELNRLAEMIGDIDVEGQCEIGTPNMMRQTLMSLEAQAAKLYFTGLQMVVQEDFGFTGRAKRPSTDPVNAMLSYGYAILYSRILTAISACGLEPFAGYLHADRSGKPSLVLDMVEEFRQVAIDRTVIKLLSLKQVSLDGFEQDGSRVIMDQTTKRTLVTAILKTIESEVKITGTKSMSLSRLFQSQARLLVRFLLGKESVYEPYTFRW